MLYFRNIMNSVLSRYDMNMDLYFQNILKGTVYDSNIPHFSMNRVNKVNQLLKLPETIRVEYELDYVYFRENCGRYKWYLLFNKENTLMIVDEGEYYNNLLDCIKDLQDYLL